MDYLDLLTLPETALVLTVLGLIFSEVAYSGERLRLNQMTALAGLGVAFIQTLVCYQLLPAKLFAGTVVLDGISLFSRLFLIILSAMSILSMSGSLEVPSRRRSEFTILMLGGTVASSLMTSSNNLMLMYLALLLLGLLGATLSSFGKESVLSTEAGFKYLLFSSLTAILYLFAAGVLFLHTGSADLNEIHRDLLVHPLSLGQNIMVFAFLFFVVSSFLGIFPMHFWLPDVLQGAPTPVSSFLSIVSRMSGFILGVRLYLSVFSQTGGEGGGWTSLGAIDWSSTLSVFATASFLLGGLLSLRQSSAKRLVAYLIMVESTYLLLGMLVLDPLGIAAGLYSLIITLFASLGVFYVLSFFRDHLGSDDLSDLRKATRVSVPGVLALVFFLICLVGLPPLPGFVGKFTLIGSVIQSERYGLAAAAVAATAFSTVAVLRLAVILVGDFAETVRWTALSAGESLGMAASYSGNATSPGSARFRAILLVLLLPLVVLAFQSDWVLGWSLRSIRVFQLN